VTMIRTRSLCIIVLIECMLIYYYYVHFLGQIRSIHTVACSTNLRSLKFLRIIRIGDSEGVGNLGWYRCLLYSQSLGARVNSFDGSGIGFLGIRVLFLSLSLRIAKNSEGILESVVQNKNWPCTDMMFRSDLHVLAFANITLYTCP